MTKLIKTKSVCKRTVAAVLLCAVAALTVSVRPVRGNVDAVAETINGVHVWTTYSDYSVMQDPSSMSGEHLTAPEELAADGNIRLDVTMGKGEIEGTQLILTPEKNVASYDVTVSDLVCGDSKIEAKDIQVFMQAYINADHPDAVRFANVPIGWYPDMLVPFDRAKAVGENKIAAGKNQGITFNFSTTAQTKAGTYTGSFTLTVDGVTMNIPVSVTVRDIDLTNTHLRTVAAATGDLPQETYEMLMNDYRVNLQYPTRGAYTPDAMVQKVAAYWDNPHFANYELPNTDINMYKAYLRELAKASYDTEHNYLTRASVYLQNLDESSDYEKVASEAAQYTAKKTEVKNELANYFVDPELQKAVFDAIDNVIIYITPSLYIQTTKLEQYKAQENGITLCGEFSTLRSKEIYEEHKRESYTPMWVYANCQYPDMGTSMLQHGQSLRLLGWNMARNDVGGYLFWDINQMLKINAGAGNIYQYTARDYYGDALAFQQVGNTDLWNMGDGALVYPAKKYGEPKSWYASLRLAKFRDGLEDHEALYMLEREYEKLAKAYGVASDFDKILDWVYEKGLSGNTSYYVDNGATVQEMRNIVFDLYELAKSKKLFLNGITVSGVTATAEFYAEASVVKANGETLTAKDGKYTYGWSLAQKPAITIELDDASFSADVFDYGTIKSALTDTLWSSKAETFVSGVDGDGHAASVTYISDGKKFRMTIEETENKEYPVETPAFRINAAMFEKDDIFDIYSLRFTLRMRFRSEISGTLPITIALEQNSYLSKTLDIIELDTSNTDADGWLEKEICIKIERLALENVQSIGFAFKSFHMTWYHMGADLEISDVYYTDR